MILSKGITARFLWLLWSATILVGVSIGQEETTSDPNQAVEFGKLEKQFKGFYTPRPLPANANFVYASVWATWSAWSFCVNGAQIRVRACNTVRGFTCPGANQERKPCSIGTPRLPDRRRVGLVGGDYDTVDPWEEDRREAYRQLYHDYESPDLPKKGVFFPPPPKKTPEPFATQRAAGRTLNGPAGGSVGGYSSYSSPASLADKPIGPPRNELRAQHRAVSGPAHAPAMTPELLFGSKLDIPKEPIASAGSGSGQDDSLEIFTETTRVVPTSQGTTASDGSHVVGSISATGNPLRVVPPTTTEAPVVGLEADGDERQGQVAEDTIDDEVTESKDEEEEENRTTQTEKFTTALSGRTGEAVTASPVTSPSHASATIVPPSVPIVAEPKESKAVSAGSEQPSSESQPVLLSGEDDKETVEIGEGEMYDDEVQSGPRGGGGQTPQQLPVPSPGPEISQQLPVASPEQETPQEEQELTEEVNEDDEVISTNPAGVAEPVNQDTAKAFQWLIENMAKATQEAEAKAAIDTENSHFLHSGEVTYGPTEHSGEFIGASGSKTKISGFSSQVPPARAFAAKTHDSQVIDTQKVRAHALPYEGPGPKITKTQFKPIPIPFHADPSFQTIEAEFAGLPHHLHHGNAPPEPTAVPILFQEFVTESTPATTTSEPNLKALDLQLVPQAPRQIKVTPHTTPTPVISSDQAASIIGDVFLLGEPKKGRASWSDWREWGECFCDKQLRTRVCNYDSNLHLEGCHGRSYESRECTSTRPCPAKQRAAKLRALHSTTHRPDSDAAGVYSVGQGAASRSGYAFQPNPISRAVSQVDVPFRQ